MKQTPKNESMRRFKRTPQRLAILEYLEGNKSHPSAEDIYRVVSKKHQSMSFATVYNTLNTLTQAGSLRELTIDPERKRYDPDTSGHHHFICVLCDVIVDIHGEVGVALPKEMAEQFTVLGTKVQFYGYCPACEKKKKSNDTLRSPYL